jgi:hypothetical protein
MYLPYLIKRHGNTALGIDYKTNLKRIESGVCDLLLVMKEKEYVAGNLIKYESDTPRMYVNGVINGNRTHLQSGVLAATYYFTCRYLQQHGYKRVNVGGSRAFLEDGVLNYKKKWGLRLTYQKKGGFILKVVSLCPAVREFFLKNPFIYLDGKEFRGALFCDNAGSQFAEALRKVSRYSAIEGISDWIVYRLGEGQKGEGIQVCCKLTGNSGERE